MDPEKIKAALEALKNGDGEAALALLEELIAGAPADGGGSEGTPLADTADDPPPEDQQLAAAASREISALQDRNKTQDATIETLRAQVAALQADRATAETDERRGLVAELVQLGAETPATAWEPEDPKDPKAPRKPVKRLADEPIASLKDRVAQLKKANPRREELRAPSSEELDVTALSQKEIADAAKIGMTPEQLAARKAAVVRRK